MTRSSGTGTARAGHLARRFTDWESRHFKPPSSLAERPLDDFFKRNPELTSFRLSAANMVSQVQDSPKETSLKGNRHSCPCCVEDSEVIVRDFGMLQNDIAAELSQLESLQKLAPTSPYLKGRKRSFWGRWSEVSNFRASKGNKAPPSRKPSTLDPPWRISVEYKSEQDGLVKQLTRNFSNSLRRLGSGPTLISHRQSLGKRLASGDLEIPSGKRLKGKGMAHGPPAIKVKLTPEQQSLAAAVDRAFADAARKYKDLSLLPTKEDLSYDQQPVSVTDQTENECMRLAEYRIKSKRSTLRVRTHPAHRLAYYIDNISPDSHVSISNGSGELMPPPLFSNSGWGDNEDRKDSGVARGYPIRRRTHECASSFFSGY